MAITAPSIVTHILPLAQLAGSGPLVESVAGPGATSVAESAADALRNAENEHFQYGLDWLLNLAQFALDKDEEALACIASDTGGNVAVLPIKLNHSNGNAAAISTFYTSAWSPASSADVDIQLITAALVALRQKGMASIMLAPLAADSTQASILMQSLKAAGWYGVHNYFCFGNWRHVGSPQNFAEYMAARPSRLRNTLGRRRRKFMESSRGSLEITRGGDQLQSAIDEFVEVYNASWKRPEPYIAFIPGLIQLAAQRGWLRLGIARCDGTAVAAQIWIVNKGTAYIFKLAYREDYRQLSPGTVLTGHMLQHVLEQDQVTTIDYLSGDDEYKQDWMSTRREFSGIAAYNPAKLQGLQLLAAHYLKALAKQFTSRSSKYGEA